MKYKIFGIILLALCLAINAADTPSGSGQKRKREDVAESLETSHKRTPTDADELANRLYEVSGTFKKQVTLTAKNPANPIPQEKFAVLQFFRDEPEYEEYRNTGIFEIVRNAAQELTPEDLMHATKQRLDTVTDTNTRGETAIALLEAANFFDITPIMQASAQEVADYLETSEAIDLFKKNPEQFINEAVALAPELGEMVAAALLKSFNNQLMKPVLTKIFETEPLFGRCSWIMRIALSSDGKKVAYAGEFNTNNGKNKVQLLDLESNVIKTIEETNDNANYMIALSSDGNKLVTESQNIIKLWDTTTGAHVWSRQNHIGIISAIALSSDNKVLALGFNDGTVRLWDFVTGNLIQTRERFNNVEEESVRALVFKPNSDELAIGYDHRTVLWDFKKNNVSKMFNCPGFLKSIAFSPDAKMLAIMFSTENYELFVDVGNLETNIPVCTFSLGKVDETLGTSVTFSPIHNFLVTGIDRDIDGSVAIFWDIHTGKEIYTIDNGGRHHIAFSKDGTRFINTSNNNTIRVWEIKSFENLIKKLTLKQAMYIYYNLQGHETNDQLLAIYNSLPSHIKLFLDSYHKEPFEMDESSDETEESSEGSSDE